MDLYTMIAEDETGSVLGSTSNHTFIYDGKTKGSRYIVDLLDVLPFAVAIAQF